MYEHIKRFFDLLVSVIFILLLSPMLVLIMILIKLDSKGPIFFNQRRMGKGGKVFNVYKFRSMTHNPQRIAGEVFRDNPEVTRIGKWLRRYKLDELIQLLNIVKGEMSFVGPRPALPTQIKKFNSNGHRRLEVTPGLTGLAQVNGNIYLSWEERWIYDRKYVEKLSFCLDLYLIVKTFAILARGEDKYVKKPNKT